MSFRKLALGAFMITSVSVGGYFFSERSLSHLREVHPDLQKLADCALDKSPIDFAVVDGFRTDEEHKKNLQKGVSWTSRSRHQDGKAIDVAAYVDGKITYDTKHYYAIAGAFYYCSCSLNIPIVSGGEWKVKDYMHIELDRKFYP